MNSAVTGKLKGMKNRLGKRQPEGAGKEIRPDKSVTTKPKNEPVTGRNIFHRAGSCKGAKPAPWIWIGGTKEVRTLRKREMILVDMGDTSP